jgi:predicted transposase YdaD
MLQPFDAATKRLVESHPKAWLAYLGLPGRAAVPVETDLTTVTAEADRVLHVEAEPSYLAHIEFQSTYDAEMDERMLRYNVLLHHRHRLPIVSVLVLLRPEAAGPRTSGGVAYGAGEAALSFRYQVTRVWEKPVEEVLAGGLATLPLAPLAAVEASALPEVVQRMGERIEGEAERTEAGILWTATYLLMGLRYPRETISQLLGGVREMKESVTYQAILEEGEARGEARGKTEGALALLLRLGEKRLGPPDAATRQALAAITSLERLEQCADRLLEVESWAELLK